MRCWLRIPEATVVSVVTIVSKVTWGVPTQSRPSAETRVGLQMKWSPLLSCVNQCCNLATTFSKFPQYQIS
jgi:hypothetical protein